MAQEVKTAGQQMPPTTENRNRIPSRPVFVPPTDIYETKDSVIVLAEMPGVAPDGVDITLERRVLTIRGRSAATEHTGYQPVYTEFADGDYERVLTLSENIDRDRIEATLKDGVLHLVLPKAEVAKARKIEIMGYEGLPGSPVTRHPRPEPRQPTQPTPPTQPIPPTQSTVTTQPRSKPTQD